MSTGPSITKDIDFELWAKYEDVAMHFNDLIMRLRTQALGGLTGVVAISGFAINFTGKPASVAEWEILTITIAFFTVAWCALAILDLCYYDRLLAGAVEAILELESGTAVALSGATRPYSIILSTRIRNRFGNSGSAHRKFVIAFYLLVALALIAGLLYSGSKWIHPAVQAKPGRLEYKLERSPNDKLEFSVEPMPPVASPSGP